jgi:hypothetical protein
MNKRLLKTVYKKGNNSGRGSLIMLTFNEE